MTIRTRHHLRHVTRWDRQLFRTATARPAPRIDAVLYPLSRLADAGKLWIATAGVLAATGGDPGRRAAARGLGSLTVTSIVANLIIKPGARRQRPEPVADAWLTRAVRRPTTTSFPSGHAASSAAFAVGASIEMRRATLPLAALAFAVGWSRVRIRVHYPLDVVAGWMVGAAIALAGARWVRFGTPPEDSVGGGELS